MRRWDVDRRGMKEGEAQLAGVRPKVGGARRMRVISSLPLLLLRLPPLPDVEWPEGVPEGLLRAATRERGQHDAP